MYRVNRRHFAGLLIAGLTLASVAAICPSAQAQILFSDSFERTTGAFGDLEPPPIPAVSDFGAFDNALGGTVSPTTYLTTEPPNNNIQSVGLDDRADYDDSGTIAGADFLQWQRENGTMPANPGEGADGTGNGRVGRADLVLWQENYRGPLGQGELRNGRVIADVNLAVIPAVQSAGGFVIQADYFPSNAGGPGSNGRDWPALMLTDTADTAIIGGPQAIANLANDNIRAGFAPRNSGSLLQRLNNEAPGGSNANDNLAAGGNPFNAGVNEPVIDQPAFSDYSLNYLGANSPSPPDDFVNPSSYSVRVDVDAPNGFGSGAEAFATVTVGGNAVFTNEPFTWGADPEDDNNVYLGFVGFGPTNDTVATVAGNEFDNLVLSSNGTTILSDNFNGRTSGNATEPGGISDWGAPNNGLGGSVSTTYLTTTAGNAQQQTVESGVGVLRSGRTIIDYNLATDSTITSNGEFTIEFEVDPSDDGNGGSLGRSWAGIALGNTNDLTNWGGALFLPNNGNARLGFAPRNSGTMLSVARGGFGTLTDGNPSTTFDELVFDQEVFDNYAANYNNGSGDDFLNDKAYTMRVEVASDFSANAPSTATVFIGEVGGTLTNIGTFDFQWGDNAGEAYIALAGNNDVHKIDNLIVEVLPASSLASVPEPSSLMLGLASLMAVGLYRGRAQNS